MPRLQTSLVSTGQCRRTNGLGIACDAFRVGGRVGFAGTAVPVPRVLKTAPASGALMPRLQTSLVSTGQCRRTHGLGIACDAFRVRGRVGLAGTAVPVPRVLKTAPASG